MSPNDPLVSSSVTLAPHTMATHSRADTATTLAALPITSVCGRLVTFAATVAAVPAHVDVPSGTVMFSADGGPATAATLRDGVATLTTPLGAGEHTVTASYTGDSRFNPAPLTTLTTWLWRAGF